MSAPGDEPLTPVTPADRTAARRLQVALLDARGYKPTMIGRVVGVTRQTVYRDLDAITKEEGKPLEHGRVAAQMRAVVEFILRPVAEILADAKNPELQLAAARTIWRIYKDRVVLEQALGTMPREAEKIEVTVDAGKMAAALLKTLAVYMDPDSADIMAGALGAIDDEQPGWLDRLLTR